MRNQLSKPRLSRRTRSLLAFAALPGLVAFAAPLLLVAIAHRDRPFVWPGLVLLAPGLALLLWCTRALTVHGMGTLAPWDPPRRLVTGGPYGRSRNPMYVGVLLVLAGWALGFRSWVLAIYAAAVAIAFHLRIVFSEEPQLAQSHARDWPRYAARVPRWFFPSRIAFVLSAVAVLAAFPIAGVFYEVYADAKAGRDYPPPGMFVDVGGRRLHVVCAGEGTPAIVFEPSGFGAGSVALREVRDRLSRYTQVCGYDRAGTGWSDPGPDAMSSGALARDLAVLQDRLGLPAPIIVVASSIGGLTAEMFARQFPERVGGLVFLDAAHSRSLRDLEPRIGRARAAATAASIAAHLGLVRLLDPFRIPVDAEEGRRSSAMTYGARAMSGARAVVAGLPRSLEEFAEAPPLPPDIAMVVLSAEDDDPVGVPWITRWIGAGDPNRIASHKLLASSSSHGVWQQVPESDHLIGTSHPEAVIDAVLALYEESRPLTGRRVRRR